MRTLALLALLASTPALADDRYDVSPREPIARQDPLREVARWPWVGVRLGGVVALGSAGGGQPGGGGGGAYVLFDARDFLADVSADIFVGNSVELYALGLGAYYPFSRGNVTPYLGGGLKVGWTEFGGDGAFGMLPFGAFGVLMGREGYVQLRAELAYFVATSRETHPGDPGPGTRAHGPMMTLALGF
ncbi:MAG TPA: hypothetical protein VM683_14045 [Anaeromyxobacteraceae bacterium]|nr:hypothetical protein [Anaeromyxobacteraceae bacterium]